MSVLFLLSFAITVFVAYSSDDDSSRSDPFTIENKQQPSVYQRMIGEKKQKNVIKYKAYITNGIDLILVITQAPCGSVIVYTHGYRFPKQIYVGEDDTVSMRDLDNCYTRNYELDKTMSITVSAEIGGDDCPVSYSVQIPCKEFYSKNANKIWKKKVILASSNIDIVHEKPAKRLIRAQKKINEATKKLAKKTVILSEIIKKIKNKYMS